MDKKKQKLEEKVEEQIEETEEKELDETGQKINELESRISDLDSQLKRAVADYRNLEQRIKENRVNLGQWATAELLNKLLVVSDYLQQATTGVSEEEKSSSWFKGVEMAVRQFNDVLRSEGLEEIKAEGEFDPSLHEAVDTAEGENNIILKVTRKGYTLHGKVLRPANVVVGRKSKAEEKESN